ncbi:MAG TPA: CHRD domain-containing protein [Steroidobacteraceae bacterium]|nr:CHRD domain-containing protein [Steroidobacteraceae bacterium]
MKGKAWLIGAGVLGLAVAGSVAAHDRDHHSRIATVLRSIEEVPAVSSPARGFFKATIDTNNQTLSYELSYEGIEGAPLQAHIHLGQAAVNGDVSVFLCANVPAPAGTPACPVGPATVTGTLTAASVLGPATQGLAPGDFDALVAAIRKGVTYVNVHSTRFVRGEIRGQLDNPSKK